MKQNECYTYFCITGNFYPDMVTELLGLQPDEAWERGSRRRDGSCREFAMWKFGRCDRYDVLTENQMHETIAPLLDKTEQLNAIRLAFAVDFSLVIVPSVYAGSIAPCLAPSLQVMDFCHETRTKLDMDLYVLP